MGVALAGETASLTDKSFGEAHRILECTQTHPPGNQHQKGYNLLVGSEGNDRKWGESPTSGIVPSLTPPQHIEPQRKEVGCPALANT